LIPLMLAWWLVVNSEYVSSSGLFKNRQVWWCKWSIYLDICFYWIINLLWNYINVSIYCNLFDMEQFVSNSSMIGEAMRGIMMVKRG
jgi:hypothetical protein